jgi:hypothetical protein
MNATRTVLPLLLAVGIAACTEQGAGVAAAGEEPRIRCGSPSRA